MPFFGSAVPSVDAYYCDSVSGSDSNAGTYNAPFATIAHMIAVDAVTPKNRWRLFAGGFWREQLTVPRANMTIDSYGAGSNPILACDDLISAGAWSKTGGRTNVYQATLTVPVNTPSDPDWYTSVWEGGSNGRYTIAHSIASVDSTPGSYYAAQVSSTTITLYVQTSDGSNPGTNGRTMEYAARMAGIMAQNLSGITLMGIDARRNINANGSIILGKDALVIGGNSYEGNKHNIFFDSGTTLIGHTCQGSYYEGLGSTMFIGFGTADATRGFTLINCSALNYGNLSDSATPGAYIHSSVNGQNFAFVVFKNFIGFPNFAACSQVTISSCNSPSGIHAYGASQLTISDSSITFNGSDQYGVQAPDTACAITLTNVTVTGPSKSGSPGTTCINFAVAGCSLVASGCTFQTATNLWSGVGAASVSIQDCTVDVYHFGYQDYTALPSYSVDHNTYSGYNSNEFWIDLGTAKTYAQWKATGQDAHSTP